MRRNLRRLIVALAIALLAMPCVFLLLPEAQKVQVLIRVTDVAQRLLRPALFRAAYQPLFRRIELLAQAGMGSGLDGPGASGEAHAIILYRDRLKAAPTGRLVFVDGGAFEGEYTDALLDAFKGYGAVEVHAFEPASAAFDELKRRHAGDARVHSNRVALGNAAGRLTLRLDPSPKMNSLVPSLRRDRDATETVEVTTLDDYAESHHLERIDILKLDVEGFELNALHGSARLLAAGRVRIVQFEYGSFALANRVLFQDILDAIGSPRALFRIVGDGLEPVESRAITPNTLTGNFVAFLR